MAQFQFFYEAVFEVPAVAVDKINNRWKNLREATSGQNKANKQVDKRNILGVKGVSRIRSGKFEVRFRRRVVGYFLTVAEAQTAYAKAAVEHWGEFARIE